VLEAWHLGLNALAVLHIHRRYRLARAAAGI
jgi:hypothetical protein